MSPRIHFEHLSLEHGLSQSSVLGIYQDEVGYMWFATEDGLNRYDGTGFVVFRHDRAQSDSLPRDFVWSVDESSRGDLWVATDGGGVARWSRATGAFTRFHHDPDDPNTVTCDRIRTVLVDRDRGVWLGTQGSGLDRLDPGSETVVHYRHDPDDSASLSHDAVQVLFQDRAGYLWVGTNGGLNRFDPTTQRFVRFQHDPDDPTSLSDDRVRAINEDRNGTLWVGTFGGGLNRLNRGSGRFSRLQHDPDDSLSLSSDQVRAVLEDRDGRLWVGTGRGLDVLEPAIGGFVHHVHDPTDPSSLSDNEVLTLYQDRGGVIWVGTRTGGINKLNPATESFGHYTVDPLSPNGLSDSNVTCFALDRLGRLWIGTFGGGLNRLDRSTGTMTHFRHDPADPASLSDDRVMALLVDRTDTLWVGTLDGGLEKHDAGGGFVHHTHHPEHEASLGANGVMSLFEDSQGTLWVGTFGGGLNRYQPETGTFATYQPEDCEPGCLSGSRVTDIAEDAAGGLWVATYGAGLNRFDPVTETALRFAHDPDDPTSLAGNTVFALHVDPADTLWVGTMGGGLDMLDNASAASVASAFRNFSERDGLPSRVVNGIEADPAGSLWLSTNRGLSRFEPDSATFSNFDQSHGLQGREFNFGSHYASADGELFFGGISGFNAFIPERLGSNTHAPPVVFTGLLKLNRPQPFDRPVDRVDVLELGYRDVMVTFEFSALDFAAEQRNQYACRLEGFDREWIDLGGRSRMTYTNLDPGSYTFKVRAANNDGVWNEDGTAISLTVQPPPWRTWWAHTAYLVMGAGLALSLVRVQRTKRDNELKYRAYLEEVVQERTEDLETTNQKLQREMRDRERAESDRRALEAKVQQAQKLESLGVLAGGVAHDFNNLLMGVLGNVDLALMKLDPSSPVQGNLEQIGKAARHAADLSTQMLAYSGKGPFQVKQVDLSSVVSEMTRLLEVTISKKADLHYDLKSNLPPVRADVTNIRQVIMNLITNASEALGDAEGIISIRTGLQACDRAYLDQTYLHDDLDTGDYVWVEIADTGAGMDEDTRSRIFDPFFTTKFTGRGLGLAAVLGIVRGHSGAISVYSEVGQGTTIKVLLPASEAAVAIDAASTEPDPPWQGSGTVLLVEDDPNVREAASALLEAIGLQVLTAEDGVAAVEVFREHAGDIAVVMLDLTMPRMSGEQAYAEMIKTRNDVPVIVCSGFTESVTRERFVGTAGVRFLQKPYRLAALREALNEALGSDVGAGGPEGRKA